MTRMFRQDVCSTMRNRTNWVGMERMAYVSGFTPGKRLPGSGIVAIPIPRPQDSARLSFAAVAYWRRKSARRGGIRDRRAPTIRVTGGETPDLEVSVQPLALSPEKDRSPGPELKKRVRTRRKSRRSRRRRHRKRRAVALIRELDRRLLESEQSGSSMVAVGTSWPREIDYRQGYVDAPAVGIDTTPDLSLAPPRPTWGPLRDAYAASEASGRTHLWYKAADNVAQPSTPSRHLGNDLETMRNNERERRRRARLSRTNANADRETGLNTLNDARGLRR
jgi:hypothetical protein